MSAGSTTLADAIATVPPGRWAVGVSGGADSVALLLLLHERPDLQLHVVHLDHETRARASSEDAGFVHALCDRLGLACSVATRSAVEVGLAQLHPNLSARYRAARLALFRQVVDTHALAGVVLAHHADDRSETVMHRLLRGSGPPGLTGMSPRTSFGDLLVLRPLLGVTRDRLREMLRSRRQAWREDESNASDDYDRNRIRRLLSSRPALSESLRGVADACRRMTEWTEARTPGVTDELCAREVLELPAPLRRELARRWLARAGVPQDRIDPATISRVLTMAEDASSAPRQHFPGQILVRRRKGILRFEATAG